MHAPAALQDDVVVVTNATAELGPGICRALAEAGARLVVGGSDEAALGSLLADLRSAGADAETVDPSTARDPAALVHRATTRWGRLDALITVPVLASSTPAEDLTFADFRAGIEANLCDPFFTAQAAAQAMARQTPRAGVRGTIIHVTSAAGAVAVPGYAAFCAAMSGVASLTHVLATEWAAIGVRVLTLAAGPTPALIDGALRLPGAASRVPAAAVTTGADLGPVVVYLAGPAARHLRGSTVYADGGWLADGYWEENPWTSPDA